MVLQDLYETEFGIYDHLNGSKSRPLASVAFHPAEDFNGHSLLKQAIDSFIDRNIKDATGMNIVEFLELPTDVVRMIGESCDNKAERTAAALEDAKRKAANQG